MKSLLIALGCSAFALFHATPGVTVNVSTSSHTSTLEAGLSQNDNDEAVGQIILPVTGAGDLFPGPTYYIGSPAHSQR